MLHVNTLCIIILKFHKEEINNYYVYHIMSTNNYACWLTLSMSKNPNQFWNLKLSAKYWNRDRKLNLKMLLCIHVHNGTSTLGHLYSWDTSTRRLFSWSWQILSYIQISFVFTSYITRAPLWGDWDTFWVLQMLFQPPLRGQLLSCQWLQCHQRHGVVPVSHIFQNKNERTLYFYCTVINSALIDRLL